MFVLEAADSAGNSAAPITYTWTVDASAPHLVALAVTPGSQEHPLLIIDKTQQQTQVLLHTGLRYLSCFCTFSCDFCISPMPFPWWFADAAGKVLNR